MFVVAHIDGEEAEDGRDGAACAPAATMEPTSEMPEMALVAAISGVCSSGGTLRDHHVADERGEHEHVQLEDLHGCGSDSLSNGAPCLHESQASRR